MTTIEYAFKVTDRVLSCFHNVGVLSVQTFVLERPDREHSEVLEIRHTKGQTGWALRRHQFGSTLALLQPPGPDTNRLEGNVLPDALQILLLHEMFVRVRPDSVAVTEDDAHDFHAERLRPVGVGGEAPGFVQEHFDGGRLLHDPDEIPDEPGVSADGKDLRLAHRSADGVDHVVRAQHGLPDSLEGDDVALEDGQIRIPPDFSRELRRVAYHDAHEVPLVEGRGCDLAAVASCGPEDRDRFCHFFSSR
mmetsp:Transcript_4776/g.10080  ORF Transcript_4776/g.10080 Transcript_4776/m.10080 type:complete len:249 (-) Transcript_4776:107-853(-)